MMHTPVIFEHPDYGTLVVTNMIDVDDKTTDDIELAFWVICQLPDGDWLLAPPYVLAQGRLMQVKRLQ